MCANACHVGLNNKWEAFVASQAKRWRDGITNWFVNNSHHHPILVVKYEALKNDTYTQVQRMLTFLSTEYNAERVKESVTNFSNMFHRKHSTGKFQHFTDQQTLYVNNLVEDLNTELQDRIHLLDVSQYMRT